MEAAGDLYLLLAVAAMSLPVTIGGLPLLCGGVFMTVGGVGTLQLLAHGWSLPSAVVTAAVVAAVVGAALGSVRRVTPVTLALATWALSWTVLQLALDLPGLTGGSEGLAGPLPPRFELPALGVDLAVSTTALLVTAVVLAAACLALNRRLARDVVGLRLRADRAGPELAASLGSRPDVTRRAVFGITAAWLAVAGAGSALVAGVVSPADDGPLLSLQLVLAALIAGDDSWWGPLLGTGVLVGLDRVASTIAVGSLDSSSADALATALVFAAVLILRTRRTQLGRGRGAPAGARNGKAEPTPTAAESNLGNAPLLELRSVTRRFGSLTAVDRVSLTVRGGQVVGLIGANGSGKTTLLRLASGDLLPDEGELSVDSVAVRPREPAGMIRAGVIRTVQAAALIEGLTVREHVALAAAAAPAPPCLVLRAIAATPGWRATGSERRDAVAAALLRTGLTDVADQPVSAIEVGQRSRVLIAAAIASGARVLCLDEPAAGLDRQQRRLLTPLLRQLANSGYGVLLVDHDIDLVEQTADLITVLQGGRVLDEGPPAAVDARHATAAAS